MLITIDVMGTGEEETHDRGEVDSEQRRRELREAKAEWLRRAPVPQVVPVNEGTH